MRATRRIARVSVGLTVLPLLLAACSPMPPVIIGPEATRSVFVPGVLDAGEDVSPLQASPAVPVDMTTPATVLSTRGAPAATAVPAITPLPSLQGSVWQWTASGFKEGTPLTPGDPARYTVQMLTDGNALIQADCNFGAGTYREEGNRLSFAAIGATKMACPPDSLDSAFLAQLSRVESYEFDGDELVLMLQDEAGEMRLAAQKLEVESTPVPPPLTPTPLPIVIPPPMSPTPTGLPATATQGAPTAARPTASQLPPSSTPTLAVPTATPPPPIMTAVPIPTGAEPVSLAGTAWIVESLMIDGGEQAPAAGFAPTLEISPDSNRVSGTTGCNTYRAGVAIDADEVEFLGPALLTRKQCSAAVMLQEVEFIDALLRATSYVESNGLLVLTGADGEILLTLARK